jgi:DNA adenine methylase
MRYHGGKAKLASWITLFFPPHKSYTEVYAGALSVLFAKSPVPMEVVNDLSGDLVNVYRVLRDRELGTRLVNLVSLTPYARDEFDLAYIPADDPVESARRTIVRAQMGHGSAGASRRANTGFRGADALARANPAQDWSTYPAILRLYMERLSKVIIENAPALAILSKYDAPTALHYVDPPYLLGTRSGRGGYLHDMDEEDHVALLSLLLKMQGMVVLSGYDNEIYNDMLGGWRKETYPTHDGENNPKTEVVWLNPATAEGQKQRRLMLC